MRNSKITLTEGQEVIHGGRVRIAQLSLSPGQDVGKSIDVPAVDCSMQVGDTSGRRKGTFTTLALNLEGGASVLIEFELAELAHMLRLLYEGEPD